MDKFIYIMHAALIPAEGGGYNLGEPRMESYGSGFNGDVLECAWEAFSVNAGLQIYEGQPITIHHEPAGAVIVADKDGTPTELWWAEESRKVRQVVTLKYWREGRGYIHSEIFENRIIDQLPENEDWSWWDTKKLPEGQDIAIIVDYYPADDESLESPFASQSTWNNEEVLVSRFTLYQDTFLCSGAAPQDLNELKARYNSLNGNPITMYVYEKEDEALAALEEVKCLIRRRENNTYWCNVYFVGEGEARWFADLDQ